MTKYTLEGFKQWLKENHKESLLITKKASTTYHYSISEEQLVFSREFDDGEEEMGHHKVGGELAKAFKTYKNEIEQKKKKNNVPDVKWLRIN